MSPRVLLQSQVLLTTLLAMAGMAVLVDGVATAGMTFCSTWEVVVVVVAAAAVGVGELSG